MAPVFSYLLLERLHPLALSVKRPFVYEVKYIQNKLHMTFLCVAIS